MHFQDKDFDSFENNTMSTEEMITFLEHLDNCSFCLEQMLHNEEQMESIPAPVYLEGTDSA